MKYILLEAYNDYDQHGDYFLAVFDKEPSISDVMKLLDIDFDEAAHVVHNGGGRRKHGHNNYDDHWYILEKVEEGVKYQ